MCFALAQPALSQTGGVVTGRVTDATGANLPDSRVELESLDTGNRLTVVTDQGGVYTFTGVPAGRYRILTTATGSRTAVPSQDIVVEVTRVNTYNITMPSGPGTDQLVQAETDPLNRTPATLDSPWNTRTIVYTPPPNFLTRTGEAFGAYNLGLFVANSVVQVPDTNFGPAIAGQRPHTNLFHIDGVDNQDRINGGVLSYLSNEGTKEFHLVQNQPKPLFGHTSGAGWNSITESGTNKVHGSIYNYLQNRHLNALDRRFANSGWTEDDNPRYDQNRLGGSIGVPIVPSKAFFFGNFEYIPLGFRAPMGGFTMAPTQAGLNQLANIGAVSNSNLGILRSGLGANVPTEATDTVMVAGRSIPVGMVNTFQNSYQNRWYGSGGLDFTISEKDQLRARYVHNSVNANFTPGTAISSFSAPTFRRSLVANISHYHTFGSNTVNELRLGYNRIDSEQYLGNMAGSPQLNIGGGMNLNLNPNRFATGIQNTYHLADTFNFRLGRHNLSAGIDFRRVLGFRTNFAQTAGLYQYGSLERFLLDQSPDVSASRAFGNDRMDMGQHMFFGFIQDEFRMMPNITVNLGARYQYAQVPRAFRFTRNANDFSVPGVLEFASPLPNNWNIAPFAGIAVSPWDRRTVIRAGAGMWYDTTFWNNLMMSMPLGFAPQRTALAQGNPSQLTTGFLNAGGLANPGMLRSGVGSYLGKIETPYSLQWNFAVQQAFWDATSIEFRYAGNKGVNQPIFQQLNASGVSMDRSLPLFTSMPTQAQLNALPLTLNQLQASPNNAFTQAGFTSPITTLNFGGNSWFHSATAALRHRFAGGAHVNANYTWSRWETDHTSTPLDFNLPGNQYFWSRFDRRHQANIATVFEFASALPQSWTTARNWFDFNISANYRYAIGQQLTPVAGMNSALNYNPFGTGVLVNNATAPIGVSGLNPLRNTAGNVVAYQVANPNARFIQPAAGVFSGFNTNGLQLDDMHNVDVAVVKQFNWNDAATFEVRGEAYNVLNRSNIVGYSPFGLGNGLQPMLGSIPGTIDVNNLNNLQMLSSNSRVLQLALRLSF